MTCNVCNMLIEENKRKIPIRDDNIFGEYWYIEYSEENDQYNIVVDYDCGYAAQEISDIHYCPKCGRVLD